MNKRQAKKEYQKALQELRTCRRNGYTIMILNHGFVDKNGAPCDAQAEGARYIQFKRPQIKRFKTNI